MNFIQVHIILVLQSPEKERCEMVSDRGRVTNEEGTLFV